jgi:DNA-binding NtrC family response regulator
VAATNRSLQALVEEGKFRNDLFYRLNVIKIDLPPLRDRPEDIPLLAQHFAEKYSPRGQPARQISDEAMQVLLDYRWPGNIRELENGLERACVTCLDGTIQPANLPPDLVERGQRQTAVPNDLSRPLGEVLCKFQDIFEKRYLRRALRKTRGHIGRVARIPAFPAGPFQKNWLSTKSTGRNLPKGWTESSGPTLASGPGEHRSWKAARAGS